MFKKGFKALKSIGKKSKKKGKEQGDGDNASQIGAGDGQGNTKQGVAGKAVSGGAVARSDSRSASEQDGGASAYPRPQLTQTNTSPVSSRASASQPSLSAQSTREISAEESVLAMMQNLKTEKESGKKTESQPELVKADSTSDDEEDHSSSSDTVLTYQKKSDASSWGDTSDMLPAVDKDVALLKSKPEEPGAAGGEPAVIRKPDISPELNLSANESGSDWTDSDSEVVEAQPRPSAVSKPQPTPKQPVRQDSHWSDTDGEDEAVEDSVKPQAMTVVSTTPLASTPSANGGACSDDHGTAQPTDVSDDWGPIATTAPSQNTDKRDLPVQSKESENSVSDSDSDSSWSDSEVDEAETKDSKVQLKSTFTKDVLPESNIVEPQSLSQTQPIKQLDESPKESPTNIVSGQGPLTRQDSEESLWSDGGDDDIEPAVAPNVTNNPLSTATGDSGVTKVTAEEVSEPAVTPKQNVLQTTAGDGDRIGTAGGDGTTPTVAKVDNESPRLGRQPLVSGDSTMYSQEKQLELSKQLTVVQAKEAQLREETGQLREELVDTRSEKEQLQSKVHSLEMEAEDLKIRMEQLAEMEDGSVKRSLYDDVTKKLKVIMDENERLANELSKANTTSSKEIGGLKKEIELLESDQDQHNKVKEDWDRKRTELEAAVKTWENNYLELEAVSDEKQKAGEELDTEVKGLQDKIAVLGTQNTQLLTIKDETTRELELLKAELNDKAGYDQSKLDMDRTARDQVEKISKLNSELTEIRQANERELSSVKEKHKQHMDKLTEDNDRSTQRADSRLESLTSQINSLQSENRSLQDKYSKLRMEQGDRFKNLIPRSEYEEQLKESELLQQKIRELERKPQRDIIEPLQAATVHGMMFDTALESRSREIQLRRERAERELQEARDRQRLRYNSTGSLTSASCESTPRRGLSPRNVQLSASSSDDDEDLRHHRYNGSTPASVNNIQQKELERQDEKIKQLKMEMSTLQQTMSSLQTEKRSLTKQLQDRTEDADDLRVQNDKLQEKLSIRDQEVTMELNKKLEKELAADAEQSKLRQQVLLLENNASRLKDANSQLEQQLNAAKLSARETVMRSQAEGRTTSAGSTISDAEIVQVRTELAQLRSNADMERATFMAAIDEKDREIAAEAADKESAKAALDEVTKSLMYLQDDMNTGYVSISVYQDAVSKANEQEDKLHGELSSMRGKLEAYSKDALEAKNVCSMQLILINEKDRQIRDKDRELRSLKKELDAKVEALSLANSQLHQSVKDRDRDHDRLRDEMLTMSRHSEPQHHSDGGSYKTLYDELRLDKERDKATTDQLIERLKWEISTLGERLQKAKDELQDKVKLETNFLLAQSEADRYKQEAVDLVRKVTKYEERVEQLQRDSDYLKDSKIEVGANNQTLKDENSRLREHNTLLKSQLDGLQRELSSHSVTKDEMETALATAKLTTDVNDMTRHESQTEVELERKHKMLLYRQAKNMRTEVNDKNIRLQENERMTERLKSKVAKLKAENSALQARLKERMASDARVSWDINTGLTHADMRQQEVQHLQSQLDSTTNDMQSQSRKAKARKRDLDYFEGKTADLEKQKHQLSGKLTDSLLMVQAAERTAADLRLHVADLTNRLRQYEDLEGSSDMTVHELHQTYEEKSRSLQKENKELERQVKQLKKRLSMLEGGSQSVDTPYVNGTSRSRSSSPTFCHGRSSGERYRGTPTTEYEKDRRALTQAAWAVLDDHGLGPPPEQRVFENLDRIWRRNASRPSRYN